MEGFRSGSKQSDASLKRMIMENREKRLTVEAV